MRRARLRVSLPRDRGAPRSTASRCRCARRGRCSWHMLRSQRCLVCGCAPLRCAPSLHANDFPSATHCTSSSQRRPASTAARWLWPAAQPAAVSATAKYRVRVRLPGLSCLVDGCAAACAQKADVLVRVSACLGARREASATIGQALRVAVHPPVAKRTHVWSCMLHPTGPISAARVLTVWRRLREAVPFCYRLLGWPAE